MPDTYTPNLDLRLMAHGDLSWDAGLNAVISTLDAQQALGSLAVRTFEDGPSASLKVKISAGTIRKSDGTAVSVAATASLTLGASVTSSIYLSDAGTVTVSTTGFPASANIVPLAVAITNASVVTSLTDARRYLSSYGAAGGSMAVGNAIGGATNGAILAADGTGHLISDGNLAWDASGTTETITGSAPTLKVKTASDAHTVTLTRTATANAATLSNQVSKPGTGIVTVQVLRTEDGQSTGEAGITTIGTSTGGRINLSSATGTNFFVGSTNVAFVGTGGMTVDGGLTLSPPVGYAGFNALEIDLPSGWSSGTNILECYDSALALLFAVTSKGALLPGAMADSAAPNGALYYSTTAGKLAFKDLSGTVHTLY